MVDFEDYFDVVKENIPTPRKGVIIEHHLDVWDKFIVQYSGGKDSTSMILYLLELGVPKEKIELWHQAIDGRNNDYHEFFDWNITEGYCEAFAEHIGIPIYFGWRQKGFWGEINRDFEINQPISYEDPDGSVVTLPPWDHKRFKISRNRFPQRASIRSGRYCSVKLKIEISRAICNNRPDLQDLKILIVSGERAEESKIRENYLTYEKEPGVWSKNRMHYRWRPIHGWTEEKVWAIIKRWGIRPHPAYELGWGRTSCMFCIFGSKNMWATAQVLNPERIVLIARLEREYAEYHLRNKEKLCSHKERCPICERLNKMEEPAYTIHNKLTILELADMGESYDLSDKEDIIKLAMSKIYYDDIFIGDQWTYPAGAFGESAGPT